MKKINTQVCIVGAGPGGAVLGFILAKSGINVTVIERAKDHHREFRGEFISPDSVLALKKMNVLNLIGDDGYLNNKGMELYDGGKLILKIDFTATGKTQPIDIPQPTLLNALISASKKYTNFSYLNKTTAKKLIFKDSKVSGVVCQSEDSEISIHSQLVVGADGRYGKIRELAKLIVEKKSIERDFVWFNLPRPKCWEEVIKLKLHRNYQLMILPTYPDMLRVGFNIPSGEYGKLVKNNIASLHDLVSLLEPNLADIVKSAITSWSQTSLLDIFTASLTTWSKDGLVVIGDAAHTLTPVLGQGVNHAISDAIVLSNYIVRFLKANSVDIISKNILDLFEKERKPDVEFVRKFQMRQEKMLQLKGSIYLFIRKIFYLLLGNTLLKNILMKKIFYRKTGLTIL